MQNEAGNDKDFAAQQELEQKYGAELDSLLDHIGKQENEASSVDADSFLERLALQHQVAEAGSVMAGSVLAGPSLAKSSNLPSGNWRSGLMKLAACVLITLSLGVWWQASQNDSTPVELVALVDELELLEALDAINATDASDLALLQTDEWVGILEDLDLLENTAPDFWED